MTQVHAPRKKLELKTAFVLVLLLAGVLQLPVWAEDGQTQKRKKPPSTMVEGYPMYELLPKDGIPAIDNPEFVPANEADGFMQDEEPVLGVVHNGEAHAYSLWTLDHHEIVNDTVGGAHLAATW